MKKKYKPVFVFLFSKGKWFRKRDLGADIPIYENVIFTQQLHFLFVRLLIGKSCS